MLSVNESKFKQQCLNALQSQATPAQYSDLSHFIEDKLRGIKTEQQLNTIAENLIRLPLFNSLPERFKYRIQNGHIFSHQAILIKAIALKALDIDSSHLIPLAQTINHEPKSRLLPVKNFFQIKATQAMSQALRSRIGKIAIAIIIGALAYTAIYLIHSLNLKLASYLFTKHIVPLANAYLPSLLTQLVQKIVKAAQQLLKNAFTALAISLGWMYVSNSYLAKTKLGSKIFKVFNPNAISWVISAMNPSTLALRATFSLIAQKSALDAKLDQAANYFQKLHITHYEAQKQKDLACVEKVWNSIFEKAALQRQRAQVA